MSDKDGWMKRKPSSSSKQYDYDRATPVDDWLDSDTEANLPSVKRANDWSLSSSDDEEAAAKKEAEKRAEYLKRKQKAERRRKEAALKKESAGAAAPNAGTTKHPPSLVDAAIQKALLPQTHRQQLTALPPTSSSSSRKASLKPTSSSSSLQASRKPTSSSSHQQQLVAAPVAAEDNVAVYDYGETKALDPVLYDENGVYFDEKQHKYWQRKKDGEAVNVSLSCSKFWGYVSAGRPADSFNRMGSTKTDFGDSVRDIVRFVQSNADKFESMSYKDRKESFGKNYYLIGGCALQVLCEKYTRIHVEENDTRWRRIDMAVYYRNCPNVQLDPFGVDWKMYDADAKMQGILQERFTYQLCANRRGMSWNPRHQEELTAERQEIIAEMKNAKYNDGTIMHEYLERRYKGLGDLPQLADPEDEDTAEAIIEHYHDGVYVPTLSETSIVWPDYMLSGRSDGVFRTAEGLYRVIDFKRKEGILTELGKVISGVKTNEYVDGFDTMMGDDDAAVAAAPYDFYTVDCKVRRSSDLWACAFQTLSYMRIYARRLPMHPRPRMINIHPEHQGRFIIVEFDLDKMMTTFDNINYYSVNQMMDYALAERKRKVDAMEEEYKRTGEPVDEYEYHNREVGDVKVNQVTGAQVLTKYKHG